ncbi:hypothetical protein KIPB_009837, partial [Kipferlia bialata]
HPGSVGGLNPPPPPPPASATAHTNTGMGVSGMMPGGLPDMTRQTPMPLHSMSPARDASPSASLVRDRERDRSQSHPLADTAMRQAASPDNTGEGGPETWQALLQVLRSGHVETPSATGKESLTDDYRSSQTPSGTSVAQMFPQQYMALVNQRFRDPASRSVFLSLGVPEFNPYRGDMFVVSVSQTTTPEGVSPSRVFVGLLDEGCFSFPRGTVCLPVSDDDQQAMVVSMAWVSATRLAVCAGGTLHLIEWADQPNRKFCGDVIESAEIHQDMIREVQVCPSRPDLLLTCAHDKTVVVTSINALERRRHTPISESLRHPDPMAQGMSDSGVLYRETLASVPGSVQWHPSLPDTFSVTLDWGDLVVCSGFNPDSMEQSVKSRSLELGHPVLAHTWLTDDVVVVGFLGPVNGSCLSAMSLKDPKANSVSIQTPGLREVHNLRVLAR